MEHIRYLIQEREREREREHTHTHTHTLPYTCIYAQTLQSPLYSGFILSLCERERESARARERERESKRDGGN